MALANLGGLGDRTELGGHLKPLSEAELMELCSHLDLWTEYPESSFLMRDSAFFMEVLLSQHEKKPTFQESVRDMRILPKERILYESTFLRNKSYNGSQPLAIPKLNL